MRLRFPRGKWLLVAMPCASLHAQAGGRIGFAPSGRPSVPCTGQQVGEIVVYSEAPTVANLKRVPVIARIARMLHVTTKAEVIERYLLLTPGEPCTELRRAESERILRAQPFIADADIYAVPTPDGGVDLEVRTSDEASIVFGGAVRAKSPVVSTFLAGNSNFAGQGVYASGIWRDGEGFRSSVAGRITHHQFLGLSMLATLEGERASRGGEWRAEMRRPFYTDLQRFAWRAQGGMLDKYVELRRPDDLRPSVQLTRKYFDIGGIARIGAPGKLSLLGASITGDDEVSGNRLTTGDTGIVHDVGPVPGVYSPHRVVRANILAGLREITFARVDSLDALTATQDIPLGFQIGGMLGHTVHALGSRDEDTFMSADLYAGAMSGAGVIRVQGRGEARRVLGSDMWDGILTTARITHTMKVSTAHVNQVRVEWSGTYRQRTPIQLLLGNSVGGIRGFDKSALVGGQRLVGHIEERFVLGRPLNLADAGVAFFGEVGRLWAGGVPFGVTTPVVGSLGVSLLGAAPPRSGRMWRADIGLPLGSGARSRWTVTLTNFDRAAFVFREPSDVSESRERTVPTSLFAWP